VAVAPQRLRVGVVGVGSMGARHVETVEQVGGEVVGIADSDPDRARAVAERRGAAAYAGWEELLEEGSLDALFVCTPPSAHAAPTVAALGRGVHVFVEKPLARTWADAEAIVQAAEASAAVCAVGYQWRAVSFLEELRAHLQGQQVALLIGRSLGPTRARPWFLDRAQGGGIMLELASHDIDLHRAIGGEIVAVSAAASGVALGQKDAEQPRIEDVVVLIFHFEDGALGTVSVGWTADGTPQVYYLDVLATEATLHLQLDPHFRLDGLVRGAPVTAEVEEHPSVANVRRFLAAAANAAPESVFSSARDAAEALRVALACEQALIEGGTIPITGSGSAA
jgi:myo-inositol 2-dehydrogenase/D-chiro-inositol 1-dehydrogenase